MLTKKRWKILIILLVSMIVFNFIGPTVVFAEDQKDSETSMAQMFDEETGLSALEGIAGIFCYFLKGVILFVGGAGQYVADLVGKSAGAIEKSDNWITAEDILFNKIAITDINFFNVSSFGTNGDQQNLPTDNPIRILKQSVANWYIALRTISIIILLAILIYIGIRMALASNPDSKKDYKKMLTNWAVSLAMVFLLHYFVIAILEINNALINIIYTAVRFFRYWWNNERLCRQIN